MQNISTRNDTYNQREDSSSLLHHPNSSNQNSKATILKQSSILLCQSIKIETPSTSQHPTKKIKILQPSTSQNKDKKNQYFFPEKKYSVQTTARSRTETQYTSIDPVTERCFNSTSKRYLFNRKYEKINLPLLIIRYEGVIGIFEKEDRSLTCDT